MKRLLFLSISTVIFYISNAQNSIGIGTAVPHASAILDVSSTTKGMLTPRMTTAQRLAIVAPSQGLMVYDTDSKSFWHHNGTNWLNMSGSVGSSGGWSLTGNSGTVEDVNFIGTTDDKAFSIRVHNRRHGYFDLHRNIFLGDLAGAQNQPGINQGNANIAIGTRALFTNTGGTDMVAIGDSVLWKNGMGVQFSEEARYNTAIGSKAMQNNTTGFNNTALGFRSLSANDIGDNNTSVGFQALLQNTSGYFNNAFGTNALRQNTVGFGNTAIGYAALMNNTTGSRNVAVGGSALLGNTTGISNTAIGILALQGNTTGISNVAVGVNALRNNQSRRQNVAVGDSALLNTGLGVSSEQNNSGNFNVAVGYLAASANTDGNHITAIGYRAMALNTGASAVTIIGSTAGLSAPNLTNATAIGFNAIVNASNKIRLGNGNVTIIEGNASYTVSDGRFKQNIKDNVPGLDFITALKPYTYQYKSYDMERFINQQNPERQAKLKKSDFSEAESMVHMGFIAQDVEKLVKEKGYNLSLVHAPTNPTDNYSIAYGELVVPLVKAVQEQQKIIEGQQKTIDGQQQRMDAQQKQIDDLKRMIEQLNKR